ncbi:MAG: 3-dehydroquinate synthase [Firmicutes bacterium]|nr:3-dehydroquinate synthase [Bacillota bacterium]
MKTLDVKSTLRTYPVIIENNLLNRLKDYLNPQLYYVIISDDHIPFAYIEKVKKACPKNELITFPQGESSKSLEEFSRIIAILLDKNIRKDSVIIALGGGVTGDLAGFIASVYLRGIPYIQIPTTLLSQIDSSVGGKVAINTDKSKNVIGNFYPPTKVLIDPVTLSTLEDRQFANGMAEMIKYGMIADKNLFDKIKNEDVKKDLEYYIFKSLEIKKRFVEADEFDDGIRQSLNFGHTFGHALEAYYRYQKYLHGEAISIGMVMVLSKNQVRQELVQVLKKYNLPTEDSVGIDDLKGYINHDKKNRNNLLKIVDVLEIGSSVITKSQYQI